MTTLPRVYGGRRAGLRMFGTSLSDKQENCAGSKIPYMRASATVQFRTCEHDRALYFYVCERHEATLLAESDTQFA